ncbi:MAG: addiction module protein [Desulfobacterales bacterium]|nr:addiction module protein [Desulfobacterales bacterium]
METGQLLEKALMLKPQDRFMLIEELIKSLDEPDKEIEQIWLEEAEKRLKAHREGKIKGVKYEESPVLLDKKGVLVVKAETDADLTNITQDERHRRFCKIIQQAGL